MKWRNVQALRFLAAFGVLLFHTKSYYATVADNGWFERITLLGFTGVDVFFVISGFILWTTARHDLKLKVSLLYLLRRFARIFSGYWPFFGIAAVIIFYLAPDRLESKNLIASWFLLPTPSAQLLIPVSWTLSFELYFYLFFTTLLLFNERQALTLVWAAFWFVLVANLYFVFGLDLYHPNNWMHGTLTTSFFLSPFSLEFLSGVLLAHYLSTGRLQGHALTVLLVGFGLIAVGYIYQIYGDLNAPGMIGAYHYPERILLFGSAAVALVYIAVETERTNMFVAPQAMVYLGDASYSLYLSHTLVLFVFGATFPKEYLAQGGGRDAVFAGLVLLMIVYSVLHYRFVERPLYRSVTGRISRLGI